MNGARITAIQDIQGTELHSALAESDVLTRGVVIGVTRKGFFLQDPDGDIHANASCGIFVFERRGKPPVGSLVEVAGKVVDFLPDETSRPTTQIEERETRVLREKGPSVEAYWLTAERVLVDAPRLRALLNSLEGMLVEIPAGSTFVAPSNLFGDYVVLPPGAGLERTPFGGVLIDPQEPHRWLPGFRVLDYAEAPQVHVGSKLLHPVRGPLNFRVASYQIAAAGPVKVAPSKVELKPTQLVGEGKRVTVLSLNGFNLDNHLEDAGAVQDPRRDVDDDLRSGRFDGLGRAIAVDSRAPDIVALQEIQDDDGAEITDVVSAGKTLESLARAVRRAGGPAYEWADIPPVAGADGGQPGGNIRNAYLYRPDRVRLVEGSLRRLGDGTVAFADSRKPLIARFAELGSGAELEIINVHLASKRHQLGLFSPERPGFDSRLSLRVEQADMIAEELHSLRDAGVDYLVTGDFNDFEFSDTLRALTADHSVNLIERLPAQHRFDYNHRGLSQALTHGVVAKRQLEGRDVEYEILHGNALLGANPGQTGNRASDHAYVIARLELQP